MPKVLTSGRVEMRANETKSSEGEDLEGKEFHEESILRLKHGQKRWERPGNT